MKTLLTIALSFFTYLSFSQTITVLTSQPKISLRGLSVVNNDVLWASGSNGTVARSVDGGKTFQWLTVKGYEPRDFRDVEAFDSNTAIIMAVAEPAVILKTKDGGKNWKKVFEDTTKGMFLDAMDFSGKIGVVVGDPINDKLFKAETHDGGNHWQKVYNETDSVITGEAMFASSGTNIKKLVASTIVGYWYDIYVTGGASSSVFFSTASSNKFSLPMVQGTESQGANSVAVLSDEHKFVVVGGDFKNDRDTTGNCIVGTYNAGIRNSSVSFSHPQTPPHGYRSCVEFIDQTKLITCGTSGVDISTDGGMNWTLISPESFHVCQKAKKGSAVFLAGKDGRIAKLDQ